MLRAFDYPSKSKTGKWKLRIKGTLLMWVFFPGGFVSIVAHREELENLMIRARNAEHLENLFPGCDVTKLNDADYRYRTVLPRTQVGIMLSHHIEKMTYDNFKSSIDEYEYHMACNRVWQAMFSYGYDK